ncbi:hypothetical protein OG357_22900 [Streptomyces sp. NBC_01255]|uniref:hypothetical protein n=1 Tax=Streptomyces sp. NBC_01255 TaxID=2903798 RepID=UPI002E34807D|nr:hypothetical protein [Streptomyces sp. NBC_01255]
MVYTPFLAGEILTAGRLNTALVEEVMEWTLLSTIGTYATNFSANASNPPQMRKVKIAGVERWEYEGRITVAALASNANTTCFTFNLGYRPAFERGWQLGGATTLFYGVRATLSTAGLLQVGVPTAAGSGTNAILLDGLYIDNPI